MKPLTIFSLFFFLYIAGKSSSIKAQLPDLPLAKKVPVTTEYIGGNLVTDNYRWLENMKDTAVDSWFKSQASCFDKLMNQIPARDDLYNWLFKVDSLKKENIRSIVRKRKRFFYIKTAIGENVGKLAFRDGEYGQEEILFDPGKYSEKNSGSISFMVPAEDGSKIAIGVAENGNELARIFILNVDTKKLYPESIYPCRFGMGNWTSDNQSFFYTGHHSKNTESQEFFLNSKLMLHVVGTEPQSDRVVLSRILYPELPIETKDIIASKISEDGKYLLATLTGVTNNLSTFYTPTCDLYKEKLVWKHLFALEDAVTGYVFAHDSIYVLTHKNASKSKILVTPSLHPDLSKARVLLPETARNLYSIKRSMNYIFIGRSDGINHSALKFSISTGKLTEVPIPSPGNLDIIPLGREDDKCHLELTSWTKPVKLFNYNASTGVQEISVFDRSVDIPGTDDIEVKEVEVESYDGTLVPLSIIYPKNLKLDGQAYCVLIGYGAYGISYTPYLSKRWPMLAKHNVIFAIAHVRGGGEKGDAWHKGGYKQTKPNSWKDFIACAEFLIQEKYTSKERLAGEGTSAGGIVIGRAITERPDLFSVAISQVGDGNILLSETTQSGPVNVDEFGTFLKKDECESLLEMDALFHVKDGVKYPAVICTTGINDSRVVPWSPGKFVAALQNSSSSGRPVMLRVDYNSGHFTENKTIVYKELADMYAFALWAMGHPDFRMK